MSNQCVRRFLRRTFHMDSPTDLASTLLRPDFMAVAIGLDVCLASPMNHRPRLSARSCTASANPSFGCGMSWGWHS